MISEATNKGFIEELLEKLILGSEHTPKILEKLFNQLMLAERETVLGAAPYERTEDRNGFANGFKDRKYLSKKELNFFRSVEHRNHVASLSEIFDGVFESDVIKKSNFPKFGITWNLRLFQIWNIKVNK